MNNIFTFMRESQVARFFIPLGLFLTIFGVIAFIIIFNSQNYIEIEATVLNVEEVQEVSDDGDGTITVYNATVSYVVGSEEYQKELDNVSKCKTGDKITIYYNPSNPNEVTQTKSFILPIIIIGFGIVSFVVGIISAVNGVKKHKKMVEQERSWINE